MSLGKRSRHPMMKRTTSMAGITVDVSNAAVAVADDVQQPILSDPPPHNPNLHHEFPNANFGYVFDTPFLRSCFLCQRRLAHGVDIYMYRGDIAFCSRECREQQIQQDERKEKQSIVSKKEDRRRASSTTTTATSNPKAASKADQPAVAAT